MSQRLHRVTGPHERFQKTNLQRGTDGQTAEFVQQLLHLRRLAQIAAGNMVGQHFLPIFLQPPRIRLLVNPVDCRRAQAHQARRHGFIGQQHAFLDQLMRHIVLIFLNAQNFPLIVQPDFGFGKVEVQRAGLEAQATDLLS